MKKTEQTVLINYKSTDDNKIFTTLISYKCNEIEFYCLESQSFQVSKIISDICLW